jgi:hypothetical protein
MKPSRSRMVCSASPVSGSDAHDLVEDVAELQARSSLRGPAFGGHGSAGEAAHGPAHRRPEVPSLPGRRVRPITRSG